MVNKGKSWFDRIWLVCQPFASFFFAPHKRERTAGEVGEEKASRFLEELGYRILFRNYRTPHSEVDLIALDGKTIVFVEVKTWSRPQPGGPSDAVDMEKQRRLTLAALAFLKSRKLLENPSRFDVIQVILEPSGSPQVRHFQNAFEAVGRYQMFA